MMNVSNGQYQDKNSILHKLAPSVKEYFLLAYIILVFLSVNVPTMAICGVVLIAFIAVSRVDILSILKRLTKIFILEVVLFIFTWIFGSLVGATYLLVRLIFVTLCSGLINAVTRPSELLFGLTKGFGLKNEYAMSLVIALTFLPGFGREMKHIKFAQAQRGADVTCGNILEKLKSSISVIIPLSRHALLKSDSLADAMDVRCYDSEEKRTSIYERSLSAIDFSVLGLIVIMFVLIIVLDIKI